MKKYAGFLLALLFVFPVNAAQQTEQKAQVTADDAMPALLSGLDESTAAAAEQPAETSDLTSPTLANDGSAPVETDEVAEAPAEPEVKPVEYVPNPSDFSADFMGALYECSPAEERQNISGYEVVSILGKVNGRCQLKYDDFVLTLPTELLPNIHSMTDIRQLLQNKDVAQYQPQYEYAGLLRELNVCSQSGSGHNAYLHRQTRNEVSITKGLTSKVKDGGCTIRLLNQLSMNDSFQDYSVTCHIPASDMELILEAYADLLADKNPSEDAYKKADAEIMFRLQQVGYCKKPKL